jgi:hypothetical protein
LCILFGIHVFFLAAFCQNYATGDGGVQMPIHLWSSVQPSAKSHSNWVTRAKCQQSCQVARGPSILFLFRRLPRYISTPLPTPFLRSFQWLGSIERVEYECPVLSLYIYLVTVRSTGNAKVSTSLSLSRLVSFLNSAVSYSTWCRENYTSKKFPRCDPIRERAHMQRGDERRRVLRHPMLCTVHA